MPYLPTCSALSAEPRAGDASAVHALSLQTQRGQWWCVGLMAMEVCFTLSLSDCPEGTPRRYLKLMRKRFPLHPVIITNTSLITTEQRVF